MNDKEIETYLWENIIPNFLMLVDKPIYSVIFNRYHEFVICTDLSARSIGFTTWQDLKGVSIQHHNNDELIHKVFDVYTTEFAKYIHEYADRVCKLQDQIFATGKVISFIDLLPYGGKFSTFLINYIPIFHPSGEVIAIQSFAIESRFFSHQKFLLQLVDFDEISLDNKKINLTQREQEIMFLLANGISQEQMAQILNIQRSTIANIIAKQLCVKFGLAGSNSKNLAKIALRCDFHQVIPRSLYRPFIIILNQDLI